MKPRQARAGEIFLSHAAGDGAAATRIAEELRTRGMRVWFSPSHVAVGQDWHREIGRALRRCTWFVLLLSATSVKSMWVERELNYALRSRRYAGRIIPVMLKPCKPERLSWTLPQFQILRMSKRTSVTVTQIMRRCK